MKPFLKWPGSKYRIIHRIKAFLPESTCLIEPFTGSASVFLNTYYSSYLLADKNHELISLYNYLQQEGQSFIDYCRLFFNPCFNNPLEFNRLRSLFNSSKDPRIKAALLLYLNKHCFNGLIRYNRKGNFNSPFSPYKKPYFPEKEMQFFFQHAIKAKIIHSDFLATFALAKKGDVVYCDPPYANLSDKAGFTHYTADGFGELQHYYLASSAKKLAAKGVTVIISNHDTEFTRRLYKGATLSFFSVQRNISSNGALRKQVPELLAKFSPP